MVTTETGLKREILRELDSLSMEELQHIKAEIGRLKGRRISFNVQSYQIELTKPSSPEIGMGVTFSLSAESETPADPEKPAGPLDISSLVKAMFELERLKEQLVDFGAINIGSYIKAKGEVWKIRAFFGDITDDYYPKLSNEFVELLFANADFCFYLDKTERYLFLQISNDLEEEIGKLTPITALDALKRFGLDVLNEVKEKSYAKVGQYVFID